MNPNIKNILKQIGIGLLIAIPIMYILGFNYLEPTQVGLARNWITGEVYLQEQPGWHFTQPWVWITRIPTTPLKVSISTASRGYSSKLVQFNTKEYMSFVHTEGWAYYWWYNRLSFNFGYSSFEEFRGFRDVMRAYAYSANKYPFITILKEYETE